MITVSLRSTLRDLDTLKYKCLVISMVTMFTLMREIAQYNVDIKRSLKKLLHKLHPRSGRISVKLQFKLLRLLVTSMQEL